MISIVELDAGTQHKVFGSGGGLPFTVDVRVSGTYSPSTPGLRLVVRKRIQRTTPWTFSSTGARSRLQEKTDVVLKSVLKWRNWVVL